MNFMATAMVSKTILRILPTLAKIAWEDFIHSVKNSVDILSVGAFVWLHINICSKVGEKDITTLWKKSKIAAANFQHLFTINMYLNVNLNCNNTGSTNRIAFFHSPLPP